MIVTIATEGLNFYLWKNIKPKKMTKYTIACTGVVVSAEGRPDGLFVDVSDIQRAGQHLRAHRLARIHDLASRPVASGGG